ncbi:MAG: hypothetical protein CL917_06485 [Deltaproteobacteria bacterium]|nr:hypothetical protein [Deltaproteobacteria bacterium]
MAQSSKSIVVPKSQFLQEQERELLERLDAELRGSGKMLPLCDARYLETHEIFEGRSNQQGLIIDWFSRFFQEHFRQPEPPEGTFRVLSVGCGSGILDLQLATRLSDQTQDFHYVGVDPNSVECDHFQGQFAGFASGQLGAQPQVEVVNKSFEDFEASCGFDLIHFVHSLYYMPDSAAALEKARRLLAPGGRIVFFQAPCEEMNALTVRFWDKEYARPTLFAEDLSDILEVQDWKYDRERINAFLEVSPLAYPDSSLGIALTDFIVQVDSLDLSEPVRNLITGYLKLISIRDEDEVYISHPVDAFVMGE